MTTRMARCVVRRMIRSAVMCAGVSLLYRFSRKSDEAANDRGNADEDVIRFHESLPEGDTLYQTQNHCNQEKADDAIEQGFDDNILIHDPYLLFDILVKVDSLFRSYGYRITHESSQNHHTKRRRNGFFRPVSAEVNQSKTKEASTCLFAADFDGYALDVASGYLTTSFPDCSSVYSLMFILTFSLNGAIMMLKGGRSYAVSR